MWLERAAELGWTTNALRKELRTHKDNRTQEESLVDSWWRLRIRRRIRKELRTRSVLGAPAVDVFSAIYIDNIWGNPESRSGWGSTLSGPNGTDQIRMALSQLMEEFTIMSIVDVPCGDFNWFRTVRLHDTHYLGVDIVPELIERNKIKYASSQVTFKQADLTEWIPPAADLIIVRDLLIHLTNEQARRCLRNVKQSGARHLLVSNYGDIRHNRDTFTGGLRLYNLQRPPFTEFNFRAAAIRALADGDGSRCRQMLFCDVSKL